MTRRFVGGLAVAALIGAALLASIGSAGARPSAAVQNSARGGGDKLLFFTSDGLRQDAVERYASRGADVPGFRDLLKHGAHASGDGLLTQAPPNTGAGWFTLATGAWPGVHGSTNNTFHISGSTFTNSTSFSSPNVLQAETLAQAAERRGKKVAQIEWVGGRSGVIDGPTLDSATSARAVAW